MKEKRDDSVLIINLNEVIKIEDVKTLKTSKLKKWVEKFSFIEVKSLKTLEVKKWVR